MKKILIPLGAAMFAVTAPAAPQFFNGSYYDIIRAPQIPWQQAHDQALNSFFNGLQGHLVTITSAAEHSFVNTIIQGQSLGEMWAGGYQTPVTETNPQAGWTWVNNEGSFPGVNSTTPYAFWNAGEPNDAYDTANDQATEQYLGLNHGPGFNDEGNLNNIDGFVIEYDPNTIDPRGVPDGGSTAAMIAGAALVFAAARRRAK